MISLILLQKQTLSIVLTTIPSIDNISARNKNEPTSIGETVINLAMFLHVQKDFRKMHKKRSNMFS